ncbi:MAG: FAD-dependent oxidoreductase, partial [Bacilli bacterium]
MKKVAIVGGGLGGLSASIYLQKLGFDVTLFERRAETGGKLQRFLVGD